HRAVGWATCSPTRSPTRCSRCRRSATSTCGWCSIRRGTATGCPRPRGWRWDCEGPLAVRLAEYTDYSLRVLMYCARHADRRVTVAELAERQGLPRNQVMKIVADFARHGLLQTARGRGGGVRLLRPA